ncbi:MAG: restriction endonuclease [Bacteroidota bacterium]|nr:restriction endonuclease [Bacteroidota bacterium]
MKKREKIYVTKASGESVEFSVSKLKNSMMRAGASKEQIETVVAQISDKLYQGIPTKKIYREAFNLLKASSKHIAAKYQLKGAIMELGPSGYPFEKFVAEILNRQGYKTQVGQVVKGQCVSHEVDVIAENEDAHFMIECKYHNTPGRVSDVKIPLYIQSRFKDVEAAWLKIPKYASKFHQGWVVTNTKFTTDAVQYGTCVGLKLVGWNYPNGESLRSLIDSLKLYPVTCLTSLTGYEKQKLLENKIVLCKELLEKQTLLDEVGIKPSRIITIMNEASLLCRQENHETK